MFHMLLTMALARAALSLMRIDDAKILGSLNEVANEVTKEDSIKEGVDVDNSTIQVWEHFKQLALDRIRRTRLDKAEKAIADMKDRASDTFEAAKERLLGNMEDSEDDASVGPSSRFCTPERDISFAKASTVYSNLGGLGPNASSPQSVRIANVFRDGGEHIDMIVTATSKYVGTPGYGKNALVDDFLVINVNSGSSVDLQFTFVDRVTGMPVNVPPFLFTIAGLEHQQEGGSKQMVSTGSHKAMYLWPHRSRIVMEDSTGHNRTTFSSLAEDIMRNEEALMKVRKMPTAHLRKSVTLRMSNSSHFEMTLSVKPGVGSRDFYFAGASNMVCEAKASCEVFNCPRFFGLRERPWSILCQGESCSEDDVDACCTPTTPEDCHPTNTLTISEEALVHSNLGGHGPNKGEAPSIFFEDVFPNSRIALDLEITSQNAYTPVNISMNTVFDGRYGSVMVAPGTSVDLLFSFYEHGTKMYASPPHRFFLSFLAFDDSTGMGINQVRINEGIIKAQKFNEDQVQVTTDVVNRTVFSSNLDGWNNTGTPEVSVLLASRSQFVVTVGAPIGSASQAFRFAGYSTNGCPPLMSLCERMTCPGGHRKRLDSVDRRCSGAECTREDFGFCCEPSPEDVCDPKNYLKLAPDAVMESNLGGLGPHTGMPEHMLISDVLPQIGRVVNLRIRAVGEYKMNSMPENGLRDGLIKIDVQPGTLVHLKLEFFSDEGAEKLEVPKFYLTVTDLDKRSDGYSLEQVGLRNHTWMNITTDNKLIPSDESYDSRRWQFFTATASDDDESHGPVDFMHSDAEQSKSVGALYEHVSEVEVILRVSNPRPHDNRSAYPRSFYLGGQTSLSCPIARESCATFVCPENHVLRSSATTLDCAGPECTVTDASTCCRMSNEEECSSERAMVISPHSLVHSNLCGMGPDVGDFSLIYHDVFPGSGKKYNLEVTGVAGCAVFDPARNGLDGTIAAISMQAEAKMGLDFKIVHSRTGEQVDDIWPYIITFMNMEATAENATSYIEIAVTNLESYQVTDRTTLHIANNTFRSGSHSVNHDRPWHPRALMPRHLARSVSLQFAKPSFNVVASVSDGFIGGHDLMFAGSSNLACPTLAFCSTARCPTGFQHRKDANATTCLGASCTDLDTTTCCMRTECSEENSLQVRPDHVRYSNLGGAGPDKDRDEAIVYADVFPASGQEVDLEVTVEGDYFHSDVLLNGADGAFGSINMAPGTDLTLHFRFVEAGTRIRANVSSFLFSIFNLTLPSDDVGKKVSVSGFDRYELPKHTKLRKEHHRYQAYFTSELDDEEWRLHGHPSHPLALGETQLNHSVTYVMPGHSEFTLSASVPASWQGQNILFAGPSNIMCAPQALCSTYECPAEKKLRKDAHRTTCKEKKCNYGDSEYCCVPLEVEDPPVEHTEPRSSPWAIGEDVVPE